MIAMCLFAMMASTSLKAQEITILLNPGWTWISYPNSDTLSIDSALSLFSPTLGDIIKSQWGNASFVGGQWRGNLSRFYPGYGYMYKSNLTTPVPFAFPINGVVTPDTVNLNPGWTWISYPRTDTLDIMSALGTFTPAAGDIIKSQWGNASYVGGQWRGNFSRFYPGYGYMYKSNLTTPVPFAFATDEAINPNDPDWVDLGLPSGLLWATCNVGANSPEGYGSYFAWGETSPKSKYKWRTYLYCCNNSSTKLTKYCFSSNYGCNGYTDTLTILQPCDDAATANYGGRMPTREEWLELTNNCTSVWTTRNGVNGRLFTGPNGNTLFLPAAGHHSIWYDELQGAGRIGTYWSSSLLSYGPAQYYSPERTWNASISSTTPFVSIRCFGDRAYGLPVRAVRED